MASTYQSSEVKSGYGAVARTAGLGLISKTVSFTNTVAYVISDVIQMMKIPKGACVLDVKLATDDLDTGTTLTLSVGDGDDDDRYIKADDVGQAGGVARMGDGVAGAIGDKGECLGYVYAAEDTIDVKVAAAPTGGGTGSMTLSVLYTLDQ